MPAEAKERVTTTARLELKTVAAVKRLQKIQGLSQNEAIARAIHTADHLILRRLPDKNDRRRYFRLQLEPEAFKEAEAAYLHAKAEKDFKAAAAANGHYFEPADEKDVIQ